MNKQEINHLLATEVMEWAEVVSIYPQTTYVGKIDLEKGCDIIIEKALWNPLENIKQAMEVADKLKESINKEKLKTLYDELVSYLREYPLSTAICMAALKAVGVEVGEIDA